MNLRALTIAKFRLNKPARNVTVTVSGGLKNGRINNLFGSYIFFKLDVKYSRSLMRRLDNSLKLLNFMKI
jgi:hypothetical protein